MDAFDADVLIYAAVPDHDLGRPGSTLRTSPLRIRVYRSLWIAGLVSNIGTFMHLVAAGWTMTTLSLSPTMVSLVQTMWAVPGFLLALHAGAFADMLDRRQLIIGTQAAALVVAAVLGVVQITGQMSIALLLTCTFIESVALTLAAPAFMALTPELVGPHLLAQALGLDAVSRNAAQALGPALAGVVIALSGPGGVFLLNAASFVGVVVVVNGYHGTVRPTAVVDGIGTTIRRGVHYVVGDLSLRSPVLRLAIMSSVGAALTAMLPLVARGRLHASPGGFGMLSAGLGLGAVAAVWLIPRARSMLRPDGAVIAAAALWSVGTALFATSTQVWFSFAGLLLAGAGAVGTLTMLFATYTLRLDHRMRGRGSAVAMLMVWLGASVGTVLWGVLASGFGIHTALLTAAVANVVVAAASLWLLPLNVGFDSQAGPDDGTLEPVA